INILVPYFLSLMLYLNFAYFLSSWLKKAGLVIGILFLYTIVIENLISWKIPDNVDRYFPINLIENLVPNPIGKIMGQDVSSDFSAINIVVAVCYILVFMALNYFMLKRGHAAKQ
ncbi:MAG: hypothetical protein MRY83_03165, partial [Flavobacteriales bacterium]|nr:hypothetical protein [Flavobacteriales bacterium]